MRALWSLSDSPAFLGRPPFDGGNSGVMVDVAAAVPAQAVAFASRLFARSLLGSSFSTSLIPASAVWQSFAAICCSAASSRSPGAGTTGTDVVGGIVDVVVGVLHWS